MLTESLKVGSLTTTSVQAITIGGEHGGLMLAAETVNSPVAWPLLMLKTPDAEKDSLLAAFACYRG